MQSQKRGRGRREGELSNGRLSFSRSSGGVIYWEGWGREDSQLVPSSFTPSWVWFLSITHTLGMYGEYNRNVWIYLLPLTHSFWGFFNAVTFMAGTFYLTDVNRDWFGQKNILSLWGMFFDQISQDYLRFSKIPCQKNMSF